MFLVLYFDKADLSMNLFCRPGTLWPENTGNGQYNYTRSHNNMKTDLMVSVQN